MNLSLDFLSLLLFITLGQGLFVLSVLILRYRSAPHQHAFLFLLVASLLWFQAEFLSVRLPYELHASIFYGTRFGAWLLLGPLFYFYIRSILLANPGSTREMLLHFTPFILFVVLIPLFSGEFHSYRQVHYGMLTSFDEFNSKPVLVIQYLYSAVFVLQFVHLLSYGVVSLSLITRYEKTAEGSLSTIDTPVRWLKIATTLLLLALLFVSVFLGLFFFTHAYDRNLDYLYVLPMAAMIYLIAFKLSGVQGSPASVSKPDLRYEKSSLKREEAVAHRSRLEEFMKQSKPYLKNELRLQELAEMVHIPTHHLSQIINEQFNVSFFDFVNGYRVEEAKILINQNNDASLLDIAFQSGFNNKTSFTNAFRKFAGTTPLAYRQQLKNGVRS